MNSDNKKEKLKACRVAVFGIGGVGGYAAEALARAGVGTLDLVDNDTVSITNINRQIIADSVTVGQLKTDAAEARLKRINPGINVIKHSIFYTPETAELFDFSQYDYVVDAIDTVTGKLALAQNVQRCGTPFISSMGTGNKLNPEMLEIADIYETSVCPLAKVMRTECRKRGINGFKCIYSREDALTPARSEEQLNRRSIPASTAFVPSVAGLLLAKEVIRDLLKDY